MEKKSFKNSIGLTKHKEFKIDSNLLATSFNRIMAYIFDLFISIIISIALNTLLLHPLMGFSDSADNLSRIQLKMNKELDKTKLFIYDEKLDGLIDDSKFFDNFILSECDNRFGEIINENPLYYYYVYYENKSIKEINTEIFSFDESNLLNDYFVIDNINNKAIVNDSTLIACQNVIDRSYTSSDNTIYNNFREYYMKKICDARELYTNNKNFSFYEDNIEYANIVTDMAKISSNGGIISYACGTLFEFILIPLIFKKKTFGQMLFKIRIVYQDNEEISYFDLITRYIMMIPILFIGISWASLPSYGSKCILLPFMQFGNNYLTYLIPSIVSLIINFMVLLVINFNKKKQPYYDRAYGYCMVTYNEKQINNKKETEDEKGN